MKVRSILFALSCIMLVSCKSGSKGSKDDPKVEESFDSKPIVISQVVEVNGIKMHYLEGGKGPLLILLHGFPSYSGLWKTYVEQLSKTYHVVAPDMRGYNLSSQPENIDDYALEKLMDDVTGLIDVLGYQKSCLVAHDWGGLIGWHLLAKKPAYFSKAVLMNAPHPVVFEKLLTTDPDQMKSSASIEFLLKPESEKTLTADNNKWLQDAVFGVSTHQYTAEEKDGLTEAWGRGLRGPVAYYQQYVPRQKELTADFPQVKVPTLLLWGEKDSSLTIKNLEGLDPLVAKLTIKRYPEGTHWIPYDLADTIIPDVGSFCAPR